MNHEPGADTRANAVRAGIASGRARRSPSDRLLEVSLDLSDRAAIQAVLEEVVRLEFAGRISRARSAHILRACSLAVSAIAINPKSQPGT